MRSFIACGDDDDGGGDDALSVEEYFSKFESIGTTAQSDVQGLSDDLEPADGLRQTGDIFDGAADDLDGLNAPSEASSVNDAAVDAARDLADAFRNLADAEGTDSEASMGEALDTALADWTSACEDVVAAGAGNGVTVDVDCSPGP